MNRKSSERLAGLFLPDHSELTAVNPEFDPVKIAAGWKSVKTIPKDRRIEVQAPPHTHGEEGVTVRWDENKPYGGVWRFDPPRGGLMVPITPTVWREVI